MCDTERPEAVQPGPGRTVDLPFLIRVGTLFVAAAVACARCLQEFFYTASHCFDSSVSTHDMNTASAAGLYMVVLISALVPNTYSGHKWQPTALGPH